jgi:hypothetical protein
MKRTKTLSLVIAALFLAFGLSSALKEAKAAEDDVIPSLMWVNHLDFLATDDWVVTSFGRVLEGFNGMSLESWEAGNKVVAKGLTVPPGYFVNGVQVCYELSNPAGFINEIRLTQLGSPPVSVIGILTEVIDEGNGELCVDVLRGRDDAPIDPSAGPLQLSLGLTFTNPISDVPRVLEDKIVVTAVGLHLFSIESAIPDQIAKLQYNVEALNVAVRRIDGAVDDLESDVARLIPFVRTIRTDLNDLEEEFVTHGHMYLTGKGEGHNNTEAYSGLPSYGEPSTLPVPPKEKKKKKSKKPKKVKKSKKDKK